MSTERKPVTAKSLRHVKVGLMSDVQYARNLGNIKISGQDRYYADQPRKVAAAMKDWSENLTPEEAGNGTSVAFDLGDIFDRRAGDEAVASLAEVLNLFHPAEVKTEVQKDEEGKQSESVRTTVYHTPGNHDFCAGWDPLLQALGPLRPESKQGTGTKNNIEKDPSSLYFSVEHEGVVFVMLDTFELAYLGAPEKVETAVKMHTELKEKASGLNVDQRRHLDEHETFNGGVSKGQLEWLTGVLSEAKENKKPVIVMSHAPFSIELAKFKEAACWNCDEVRAVINSCGGSSTVAACITGHDHFGSQWRDPESGIPHVVIAASLISSPEQAGHAILTLGIDDATGEVCEAIIDGRGGIVSDCALH